MVYRHKVQLTSALFVRGQYKFKIFKSLGDKAILTELHRFSYVYILMLKDLEVLPSMNGLLARRLHLLLMLR